MNSKNIGDISEAMVIAELLKREISVSKPFGDNQRYDLIMDFNNKLYKIQTKTVNHKEDFICFPTSSSNTHRGKGRKNYKGEVDYILAYCHKDNLIYMLPIEESSNTGISLRINPPKNNQVANIKWAKDYLLDKQLSKI